MSARNPKSSTPPPFDRADANEPFPTWAKFAWLVAIPIATFWIFSREPEGPAPPSPPVRLILSAVLGALFVTGVVLALRFLRHSSNDVNPAGITIAKRLKIAGTGLLLLLISGLISVEVDRQMREYIAVGPGLDPRGGLDLFGWVLRLMGLALLGIAVVTRRRKSLMRP